MNPPPINFATAEEFERAHAFISALIERCGLSAARCVIVPGNHDLNWDTEGIFEFKPKRAVDPGKLRSGSYVEQTNGFLIRNEAAYGSRFENFNKFYHHAITAKSASIPGV